MGNLARKQQTTEYTQQMEAPTKRKKGQRFTKVTLGEKLLFFLLTIFITFMATKLVSVQAAIYEVNKEIQDVEAQIDDQKKLNDDLSIQVSELSRYERVWQKAKELGLDLNENNVKVVEKK